MRLISLGLILLMSGSATGPATLAAQQLTDSTTVKTKKAPSKFGKIVKRLADTAGTVAAGAGVQSLLGKKAGGVANALGAGGVTPCGAGYGATAGSKIVGAAKGVVKHATTDDAAAAAVEVNPCTAMGIPGMPGSGATAEALARAAMANAAGAGVPGAGAGAIASAAAQSAAISAAMGGSPMGALGVAAKFTPVGLAASAAPGAIKGIKGMLGGKPQDKTAMLRDLGKGKLELKDVKFIEGTAEMEPGFEASLTALGEALPLAEGKYALYLAAEAEDKAAPDTTLQRKRIEKLWAAMLVGGVSDKNIVVLTVLPPELQEGHKTPKPGKAKVELIRLQKQQ